MITEFTCGIYRAIFDGIWWEVKTISSKSNTGFIDANGNSIKFSMHEPLTSECLIEIAALMNNIKRQYKQLKNG